LLPGHRKSDVAWSFERARQQLLYCCKVGFILARPPFRALMSRLAVLQEDTLIDIAVWTMIAPHTAAEQIGVKAFRWL
jgi:hypothetical protein